MSHDLKEKSMSYEASDKEFDCLVRLFQSYRTMIDVLGWREAHTAPMNIRLWLIELGSSGVHEGWRSEDGFWIFDGEETYMSNAILFKVK